MEPSLRAFVPSFNPPSALPAPPALDALDSLGGLGGLGPRPLQSLPVP
jgi:hypothetical protein